MAFIPVLSVLEIFEFLVDFIFSHELHGVVDYLEDTWMCWPYRRNRRRAPLFKHEVWNCFQNVIEAMANTNSTIADWHNSFEHQVIAHYPSFWKFIDVLKRKQSL